MSLILPGNNGGDFYNLLGDYTVFKKDTISGLSQSRLQEEGFHLMQPQEFRDDARSLIVDEVNYDPGMVKLSDYDLQRLGIEDPEKVPKTEQVIVRMHDPKTNFAGQVNIDTGFDDAGYRDEKFTAAIFEPRNRDGKGKFIDSASRHMIDKNKGDKILRRRNYQLFKTNSFKDALNYLFDYFFFKTFDISN